MLLGVLSLGPGCEVETGLEHAAAPANPGITGFHAGAARWGGGQEATGVLLQPSLLLVQKMLHDIPK